MFSRKTIFDTPFCKLCADIVSKRYVTKKNLQKYWILLIRIEPFISMLFEFDELYLILAIIFGALFDVIITSQLK